MKIKNKSTMNKTELKNLNKMSDCKNLTKNLQTFLTLFPISFKFVRYLEIFIFVQKFWVILGMKIKISKYLRN